MSIDNKRFLRRHFPSFAPDPQDAKDALKAYDVLAVRTDGLAFFRPRAKRNEVWVGWLVREKNGPLVTRPTKESRFVCTFDDFMQERDSAQTEARQLLRGI